MCTNNVGKSILLGALCLFLSLPSSMAKGQDDPLTRPIKKTRPEADQPGPTSAEKNERKAPAADAREKIYQKWLDEDALWILTDQERADFSKLNTNQQRDEFVVAFWERRNPTPQSSRNPYKEVHYQRLAYANTHFAAAVPGYRTDRGRFYILYGPPDSVDSRPGSTPPSEIWRYMFVEGIGRNVVLNFTDNCACGKYQLSGTNSNSRAPQIFDPLRQ